jgi:parallel beta-helix repeat protein
MKKTIQTLLQAHINLRACFFALFLAAAILPQAATATVRYVKPAGTGNGLTWATASGDLQAMINESNPATDDEVWVFDGTYKPQYNAAGWNSSSPPASPTPGSRDNAFVLKAGVKIYGGFNSEVPAGTVPAFGTAGRNGTSTLSGDIGTLGSDTDNAYHVVIGAGITNDGKTVLDGFTVSGGNAYGGSGSITVNSQNYIARNRGGGIYNTFSSPVLTRVTVSGNTASGYGGGICNESSSFPVLTGVTISGNRGNRGGGISNTYSSSPHLTGVTISGNEASTYGGGIYNDNSSPVLTNVTISGNKANNGGGIYNNNYNSFPVLTNTIVWGSITNNSGNLTYNYCLVQGANPLSGTGNLDDTGYTIDQLFETPGPPAPTTAGDYRLKAGSPVRDLGNNDEYRTSRSLLPASFTGETDLAGKPRLYGSRIDIGAYEFAPVPTAPQNLTATPGNGEVTLAWTVPADNGGATIDGYRVSIDGGNTWLPAGNVTGYTVTGLANGTSYTFYVHATTGSGDGAEASVMATPESCSIALSPPATYTFPAETCGYDALAPLTVTVTNTGSQPTGPLTATLTGVNPGAFVLAPATPDGVPVRLTTAPPGTTTRLSVPSGIYIVSDGGAFRQKTVVVR